MLVLEGLASGGSDLLLTSPGRSYILTCQTFYFSLTLRLSRPHHDLPTSPRNDSNILQPLFLLSLEKLEVMCPGVSRHNLIIWLRFVIQEDSWFSSWSAPQKATMMTFLFRSGLQTTFSTDFSQLQTTSSGECRPTSRWGILRWNKNKATVIRN